MVSGPDVWDDTEGRNPPSPRRKLGASITVRLSAEEADNLRQMAKAKTVSYAEVIGEALNVYAESGRPLKERVLWVEYHMV